jgi:hypothetical protein
MSEFQQNMYDFVLLLSASITIYALTQQAAEHVFYFKINNIWNLTPIGLVHVNRCFKVNCCLYFQGKTTINAVGTFKTWCKSTEPHVPHLQKNTALCPWLQ